jgi:hypothetical protein
MTDEGVSEEADASGDGKRSVRRSVRKGPPEDGTPSTTTIYVANIPFEYTDDKVHNFDGVIAFTDFTIAKGALRGIQSDFCIYCSSSNPSIRHQETCGTWRTSKRSWIWLCDFR